MRRSHTKPDAAALGINLTPLIDVVFILLIFFVVSSSFVRESGIDVERPAADTAVPKVQGNIVVTVTDTGAIWLEGREVDRRAVRAHIARQHADDPAASVVIVADTASRTGAVIDVVDQARLAGVASVAIATTPREEE
ncbi:MAG: biopolymer transporter ExbD [Gammaproteobacteria bacterium]|jgi:biopolymer transport protein ExbD|nr:biopolymer transporter ExbD [Gammaproteobacteria bacterium]